MSLIVVDFSAIINHTSFSSMKHNKSLFYYLSFSITILLSAFLLFQIQPLIGKYILPWFGGTSFVWITSLLFFQTVLLGGYLYSFLITKLSLKQQLFTHSILVTATAITMVLLFFHWASPITPDVSLKLPDIYSPVIQVLSILFISVGLPYFLLSTTSTLLQRWFSLLPHQKSPYPLYALSNIGSLVAIGTYPFVIEPFLPIQNQGKIWSVVFITLCLLLLLCIFQMFRSVSFRATNESRGISYHRRDLKISGGNLATKVGMTNIRLWLFLPAISSIVLLAGTHQLTQGIAPIPFLWLIPLGLYLLSFILCFSERQFYKRNVYSYVFLLSLPIILSMTIQSALLGVFAELGFYAVMLFSCFMICHGELFASRPDARQLNSFYLLMALGSVLGSLLVAVVAPIFFVGLFWEFLLGLFITTLVAILIPIKDSNSFFSRRLRLVFMNQKEMTYFLVTVVCGFYAIFATGMLLAQSREAIGIWRNFYGTLRVLQDDKSHTRCLLNGKIIHGCQSIITSARMKPATYFGENSVGLAVKSLRENTNEHLRIGVIGLGVGTIATYGKRGDLVKFYELNPLDAKIANEYFTYLKETPATVETIIGDGRLSMEKELHENKPQQFNLFVVDAFNDDAIPVHLLTKEAFAMYKKHLTKKGIIAVHISNSYLDLTPVVAKAAEYHNMHIIFIDAPPANKLQTRSLWAFLSDDEKVITTKELQKFQTSAGKADINLWTDNYSNLFQLLK